MGKFDSNKTGKGDPKNTAYKTEKKSQFKEDDLCVNDTRYELIKPKTKVMWNGGTTLAWNTVRTRIVSLFEARGLRSQLNGTEVLPVAPDRDAMVTGPYLDAIARNDTRRDDAITDLNENYGFQQQPPGVANPNPGNNANAKDYRSDLMVIKQNHHDGREKAEEVRLRNDEAYRRAVRDFVDEQRILEEKRIEGVNLCHEIFGQHILDLISIHLAAHNFVAMMTTLDQTYGIGVNQAGMLEAEMQDYITNVLTYVPSKMTFDGFCDEFNRYVTRITQINPVSQAVKKKWFKDAVKRGFNGLDTTFEYANMNGTLQIHDAINLCKAKILEIRNENSKILSSDVMSDNEEIS